MESRLIKKSHQNNSSSFQYPEYLSEAIRTALLLYDLKYDWDSIQTRLVTQFKKYTWDSSDLELIKGMIYRSKGKGLS